MLALMAVAWLAVVAALEALLTGLTSWNTFFTYTADTAASILGGFPEVIVAILGITITVVSITLQLAATRYSHRVTEMFFHDAGNLGVLAFYVIASIHCIAAAALIHNGIVPHVFLVSTLGIVAVAVLILIPYFIYVFAFLDPARLVTRLEHQAIQAYLREEAREEPQSLKESQKEFREAVEQLSDVAIHAISKMDRGIASMTTEALKQVVVSYIGKKQRFGPDWFKVGESLRRSPELEIMAVESIDRLEQDRSWLEWMILRQLATIYQESLNKVRDVVRLVSINTRQLGEYALRVRDRPVLNLVIRFFNSFLRAAINARDVRSAYNVLDQYRHLAESALEDGNPEVTVQIGKNLSYYAQLATKMGLPFIAETAAFDLGSLCMQAHPARIPGESNLLGALLTVDDQPETRTNFESLHGCRKAQVKLATYYLSVGATELAQAIADDMEDEPEERLEQIKMELRAAEHPEFWEIIDRGQNFDYLPPEQREQLDNFSQLTKSQQMEINV
jgi:hypothetical protein